MTPRPAASGPEDLTDAVIGLDGVRGLFPEHVINAIVPALAGGAGAAPANLVEVEVGATGAAVRARLALDRAVPTAETLRAVRAAVIRLLGEDVEIDLEVAYID